MRTSQNRRTSFTQVVGAMLILACGCAMGCQVSVGGQTLPSAYWLKDDIQYFPKGPEFPLSNEAAAAQQFRGGPAGP